MLLFFLFYWLYKEKLALVVVRSNSLLMGRTWVQVAHCANYFSSRDQTLHQRFELKILRKIYTRISIPKKDLLGTQMNFEFGCQQHVVGGAFFNTTQAHRRFAETFLAWYLLDMELPKNVKAKCNICVVILLFKMFNLLKFIVFWRKCMDINAWMSKIFSSVAMHGCQKLSVWHD